MSYIKGPLEDAERAGKYSVWETLYLFHLGQTDAVSQSIVRWAEAKMQTHKDYYDRHEASKGEG